LDCSAVTIPANQDATITRIKSILSQTTVASGKKLVEMKSVNEPSGVSDKLNKSYKLKPLEKKMSILEKIKAFEDELASKKTKLNDMMVKSLDSGETFDDA